LINFLPKSLENIKILGGTIVMWSTVVVKDYNELIIVNKKIYNKI